MCITFCTFAFVDEKLSRCDVESLVLGVDIFACSSSLILNSQGKTNSKVFVYEIFHQIIAWVHKNVEKTTCFNLLPANSIALLHNGFY